MRRKFTDLVLMVGAAPARFSGEKRYISTGAVNQFAIDESSVEMVTYDNRPSRANLTAQEGDVLFAKMAETLKTLCLDDKLAGNIYSTGFCAVRAREQIMTTQCLYYLVSSPTFLSQKDQNASGATQRAITNGGLANIYVNVPTLEEQKKAIKTLDFVSLLIAKRKTQLAAIDDLVKSQFIEMFGDPVRNEKGWTIVRLGEVAELKIGPFGSLLHKEDYICGGHKLVNPSHIEDGKIKADENLSITDEKYEELSAYHLKKDDIVLGRRGEMGRCAVVQDGGLLCGTGCMIIRPNGRILPYFMQSVLSSPSMKLLIENRAVGVTMANLNVPIVSNLPMPLYPMDKQKEYISLLEQTDKSKFRIKQSLEKLELCYKSLLQKYFG